MSSPTPIKILLVEDSPGDVRLVREVLQEAQVPHNLEVADNGVKAIALLSEKDAQSHPDLILLDLNLPCMNGPEVLATVKGNPETRRIPVVILTTSNDPADILRAYDLHANCYLTKPVTLDEFSRIMRTMQTFWLETAKLPTG